MEKTKEGAAKVTFRKPQEMVLDREGKVAKGLGKTITGVAKTRSEEKQRTKDLNLGWKTNEGDSASYNLH